MPGLGESNFKARYQKPGKRGNTGWKGVPVLPRRKSFDEAQADLNQWAEKKRMRVIDWVPLPPIPPSIRSIKEGSRPKRQ